MLIEEIVVKLNNNFWSNDLKISLSDANRDLTAELFNKSLFFATKVLIS